MRPALLELDARAHGGGGGGGVGGGGEGGGKGKAGGDGGGEGRAGGEGGGEGEGGGDGGGTACGPRVNRSTSCVGTEPVRALPSSSSNLREVMRAISEGRLELSVLLSSHRLPRDVIRPISVGTAPLNRLPRKPSWSSDVSRPTSVGMVEVRSLSFKVLHTTHQRPTRPRERESVAPCVAKKGNQSREPSPREGGEHTHNTISEVSSATSVGRLEFRLLRPDHLRGATAHTKIVSARARPTARADGRKYAPDGERCTVKGWSREVCER
jgi:hypothetical protein